MLKSGEDSAYRKDSFERSAKDFLKQDFLSFTLARMLGPDYFKYIFHISPWTDRAGALEYSFENAYDTGYYPLHFSAPMDSLLAIKGRPYHLPVLCINTTRIQDGRPGIVSNIEITPSIFSKRVDVLNLFHDTARTIHLSTAAILGARFPYISPAGRIDEKIPAQASPANVYDSSRAHYFVDGGYFDNSGAGVVQEMIRAIIDTVNHSHDAALKARASKLKFVILHITNSPVGEPRVAKVSPVQNDLTAPILTILGAYNMQTSVNDNRLITFIDDINRSADTQNIYHTDYYPIHLYREAGEPRKATDSFTYAMNWFISDTVRNNMDRRLDNQPRLKSLIDSMKRHSNR